MIFYKSGPPVRSSVERQRARSLARSLRHPSGCSLPPPSRFDSQCKAAHRTRRDSCHGRGGRQGWPGRSVAEWSRAIPFAPAPNRVEKSDGRQLNSFPRSPYLSSVPENARPGRELKSFRNKIGRVHLACQHAKRLQYFIFIPGDESLQHELRYLTSPCHIARQPD